MAIVCARIAGKRCKMTSDIIDLHLVAASTFCGNGEGEGPFLVTFTQRGQGEVTPRERRILFLENMAGRHQRRRGGSRGTSLRALTTLTHVRALPKPAPPAPPCLSSPMLHCADVSVVATVHSECHCVHALSLCVSVPAPPGLYSPFATRAAFLSALSCV